MQNSISLSITYQSEKLTQEKMSRNKEQTLYVQFGNTRDYASSRNRPHNESPSDSADSRDEQPLRRDVLEISC
jgi:hypothetical protein